MAKILVTYATMAGSTSEVAQVVAEEIGRSGAQVGVLPLEQAHNLSSYDGVVLGAPMIMGLHRDAQRFLRKHRQDFQHLPLAVFIMAMSLTQPADMNAGAAVYVDEMLSKPPQTAGRLTLRERYTLLTNYLRPVRESVRPAEPVSVGVFGGRLDFSRLKWWAMLFVLLIVQAQPGERRNWPAIRAWAAGLPAMLVRP